MKRQHLIKTVVVAVAVMLVLATVSMAQQGPGRKGHGRANVDPEEKAEIMLVRLAHRLELTESQKAELLPILQKQAERIVALRQEMQFQKQAHREQMDAMRAETHAKIEALLSPDQLEKFQEMQKQREEMRERRAERRSRGGRGRGSR